MKLLLGVAVSVLLGWLPARGGCEDDPTGAKPYEAKPYGRDWALGVPDNETAWKRLPPAEKGADARLPKWARMLSPSLPRTAAAMLELDYLYREKSPLEPRLRGLLRLAVARANGCAYAEAEATADLRRAGLDEAGVAALAGKPGSWPGADGKVLDFAQKLTAESQTVTDDEVAALVKRYGESRLVALVQHIAYANFQDRLLFGLGLAREAEASLAAAEVRFARPPLGARLAQPRPKPRPIVNNSPTFFKPDRKWLALDLEALRNGIESQKSRRPRIALPAEHDVVIHWGQVCRQHQPELANAWSYCMWTFGAEGLQDPELEASVLWVVTRTERSFY